MATVPANVVKVEGDATPKSCAPPGEFALNSIPTIKEEAVPLCPVCGADECCDYATGFDYELQTCANAWKFVSCASCGHVWLNPRPSLQELLTIYPPEYYAYDFESRVNVIALKGKALLDRIKFRGILKQVGKLPRTYLDIGCGSGRFLRVMNGRGVPAQQIYGLELSEEVVGKLRGDGFQVFCERVEECVSIPDNGIELATMFHVIEHVHDPSVVASQVREWLVPGGILAIETPNIDSWDARLFKRTFWGGYHIPRHWNLFSPETLTRMLGRAGFEVIGTEFQTGHSFWMYSLHHLIRYGKPRSPAIARYFDPLRGLPFLMAFTAFDKLRAKCGMRTSSMLVLARKT